MTNKVASMNENDNDSHLDLQLEIKNIYIFLIINLICDFLKSETFLLAVAFNCKVGT